MGDLAPHPFRQAGASGLRLFRLEGDAYEPDLRGGDFLMVAPVARFAYDGDYLLDMGGGEVPYVVTSTHAGFSIRHRNPRYSRWELTREQFIRAVRAIVVAEVKVRDTALMYEAGVQLARGRADRVAA